MRVLLDTNVLVAAFISHGVCQELLEHCFHNHELVTTEELLKEFRTVLTRKFRFTRTEARESIQTLRLMIRIAKPKKLEQPVCRDPDDDEVLAAAIGGGVECIVTGDKDLLTLKDHRGIAIISPTLFWRFEDR